MTKRAAGRSAARNRGRHERGLIDQSGTVAGCDSENFSCTAQVHHYLARIDILHAARHNTPPMTPAEFWHIVQSSPAPRHDHRRAATRLLARLATLDNAGLAEFERRFRAETEALDLAVLHDTAAQLWALTDESWLHLRAWCVSQGEPFVRRMRVVPEMLRTVSAEFSDPFCPPTGELFLYCADYARVQRETSPTC